MVVYGEVFETEAPAWSLDGRMVAFVHEVESTYFPVEADPGLHVMNADGTGERTLTRLVDPKTGYDLEGIGVDWSPDGRLVYGGQPGIISIRTDGDEKRLLIRYGHSPSWSPDGRKLAYVQSGGDGSAIFVANADGTDRRRVTLNLKVYDLDPRIFGVDWSPDSSWLVFAAEREDCGRSDIYLVKADGSDLTRITDSGWNAQPAWRPTSAAR